MRFTKLNYNQGYDWRINKPETMKTREKKKVLQKKRIKDYEEEDAGDDACPLFFFFLFSSFKKKHNILRYIQKILCKYY